MLTAMPSGLVEEICRGRVGDGNLFTSQCRQACPRPVIPEKAGIHPRFVRPAPVPSFLRRQESIPIRAVFRWCSINDYKTLQNSTFIFIVQACDSLVRRTDATKQPVLLAMTATVFRAKHDFWLVSQNERI